MRIRGHNGGGNLMATKVHMEALSPTMEEGQVVRWLKNEGDAVQEGDVLAEIETDKATMELVARGEGVLRKQVMQAGATAPVGAIIGVIAAPDEDISGILADTTQVQQGPTSGETAPPPEAATTAAAPEGQKDVASAANQLANSEKTEPDSAELGSRAAEAQRPTPGMPGPAGAQPAPAQGGNGGRFSSEYPGT